MYTELHLHRRLPTSTLKRGLVARRYNFAASMGQSKSRIVKLWECRQLIQIQDCIRGKHGPQISGERLDDLDHFDSF